MALLSVVIPSYNEESNIRHTAEVLSTLLQREQINYELLFVSDGSKDQTFPLIRRLAEEDGPGYEACSSAGISAKKLRFLPVSGWLRATAAW